MPYRAQCQFRSLLNAQFPCLQTDPHVVAVRGLETKIAASMVVLYTTTSIVEIMLRADTRS